MYSKVQRRYTTSAYSTVQYTIDWQQHVYIRLQYTCCEHQQNTKIGAHLPHLLNEVLVSEIFCTDLTLVFLFADISAANGTSRSVTPPHSLTKTLPNYFIVPIFITGQWNDIKMGTVYVL